MADIADKEIKCEEEEVIPHENVTAILSPGTEQSIKNGSSKLKTCCVPFCNTNSDNSPNKHFINVPKDPQRRLDWFDAMKLEVSDFPRNATLCCCENHFNAEQDFMNFYFVKMMKNSNVKLKVGVVPHVFDHYDNWDDIMPPQLKPSKVAVSKNFASVSDELYFGPASNFEDFFSSGGNEHMTPVKTGSKKRKGSTCASNVEDLPGSSKKVTSSKRRRPSQLKTSKKKKECIVPLGKHYSEYRVQRVYDISPDQKSEEKYEVQNEILEFCDHIKKKENDDEINIKCEGNSKSTQYKFVPEQRSVNTNVNITSVKHVGTETSSLKRKNASTNTLHVSDEEISSILSNKRVKCSKLKTYYEESVSEQSEAETEDEDWEIPTNKPISSESDFSITNSDNDDDAEFQATCLNLTRTLHERSWQHYLGLPSDCYWVLDRLAQELKIKNRSLKLSNRDVVELVLRKLTLKERYSKLADYFGFNTTRTIEALFASHSQFIIDSLESIGVVID